MLVRFRREMEICEKVDHPNLTRTFESGAHNDVNYIAMEFIPGRNLYRLVQDEGPLEVSRGPGYSARSPWASITRMARA